MTREDDMAHLLDGLDQVISAYRGMADEADRTLDVVIRAVMEVGHLKTLLAVRNAMKSSTSEPKEAGAISNGEQAATIH